MIVSCHISREDGEKCAYFPQNRAHKLIQLFNFAWIFGHISCEVVFINLQECYGTVPLSNFTILRALFHLRHFLHTFCLWVDIFEYLVYILQVYILLLLFLVIENMRNHQKITKTLITSIYAKEYSSSKMKRKIGNNFCPKHFLYYIVFTQKGDEIPE